MELLAERRLEPVVICESAGTQAEDAQAMQRMFFPKLSHVFFIVFFFRTPCQTMRDWVK